MQIPIANSTLQTRIVLFFTGVSSGRTALLPHGETVPGYYHLCRCSRDGAKRGVAPGPRHCDAALCAHLSSHWVGGRAEIDTQSRGGVQSQAGELRDGKLSVITNRRCRGRLSDDDGTIFA